MNRRKNDLRKYEEFVSHVMESSFHQKLDRETLKETAERLARALDLAPDKGIKKHARKVSGKSGKLVHA